MRRMLIASMILAVGLVTFGSLFVPRGNAEGKPGVEPQPGTRCTRLTFGPKPKKKPATAAVSGMPGTRCARLSSGGKPGSILPNTPPNVGLVSSTASISTNAVEKVNLKAREVDDGCGCIAFESSTVTLE